MTRTEYGAKMGLNTACVCVGGDAGGERLVSNVSSTNGNNVEADLESPSRNSKMEKKFMDERVDMISVDNIRNRVYTIRGRQVMLDYDLAEIYGYEVKRLNEQVKRNIARFPDDFMFQLTEKEQDNLKSQFATSSWGGKRKQKRSWQSFIRVLIR